MRSTTIFFFPVIVLLAGCASTGSSGGTTATPVAGGGGASPAATAGATAAARPARGNLNLISSAEIEAAGADVLTAFDLVERLRPTMLRVRGQTAGAASEDEARGPVAYVNESRLGAPENLRTVPRSTVREIRYVGATDATTRWGTGHASGAIQVILKR